MTDESIAERLSRMLHGARYCNQAPGWSPSKFTMPVVITRKQLIEFDARLGVINTGFRFPQQMATDLLSAGILVQEGPADYFIFTPVSLIRGKLKED